MVWSHANQTKVDVRNCSRFNVIKGKFSAFISIFKFR